MICPRCREKNSEEDKVCKNCGLKLKTICPRCKEPNKLGQAKCVKCALTLIRFCPACKTPNFPHVKNCRKCGVEMLKKTSAQKKQPAIKEIEKEKIEPQKEIKQSQKPEKELLEQETQNHVLKETPVAENSGTEAEIPYNHIQSEQFVDSQAQQSPQDSLKKELSRSEALIFLQNLLNKSEKGGLIGVCSPEGLGKSTIFSSLPQSVKERQLIWLIGQSEPNKIHVPFTFFQNLMCALFGISNINFNKDEIKKSLKKTFETTLEITDEKVLDIVCKIALNEYKNCKETIEENRLEVYESIQKIFAALEKKAPLVLFAEDFEFIDKASFACLKYLLKNGFLDNKNFLIINHIPSTNLPAIFPEEISSKKALFIFLKYLNNDELNNMLLNMMNNQNIVPESLKYRLFRQSKGLPIYVEQVMWYFFQTGAIYTEEKQLKFNPAFKDVDISPDLTEIFKYRIDALEKISPEVEKIMYTASIFGFKFTPKLIQTITEIEDQKMQESLQILVNNGIFSLLDQHTLVFKHLNLWKIIFEKGMNNGKIPEIISKILPFLESAIPINSAFAAKLAEYAGDSEKMLYFYKKAARESFCLGDIYSYTDNQLRVYELLSASSLTEEEKESAKINICEQIGIVNFELNPSLAIKYLTESIKYYEKAEDNVKLIELTGYMSKCLELTGDFVGVYECADKAVGLTQKGATSLEVMLLNYPKIDAAFNLGRLEEAIITAQDEMLPFLNKAISKNETLAGLNINDIKAIEYETEFALANALIFQGNKQALEVLNKIISKAEKENQQDYLLKALLDQALFSIIQGDLISCDNIINNIKEKGLSVNKLKETRLSWMFISILSNMLTGKFEQARNICYSALSLAKESKNYNLFVLIKLLSGYFYQHFQYYKNAVKIYEETANYCSETKMATGALYSWYLAAEAELQTGNPDKAREIAEKALDISQKPNINNFIASIILSKLIAEVKIIKGDLEGAQINVENALTLAESNDLYFLLIELYIALGKIYQENASSGSLSQEKRDFICSCAYRAYTKAYGIGEKLDNYFILDKVEKTVSNLITFCKLSGITLDK
ncbi:MAG TPA: zinc ribbon domain-containing protein [Candidatus Gastranaerophilales bacterium]|nr:zinc ribbon domain-containing protein [Candidatus Gastranaerophilales bacterium]